MKIKDRVMNTLTGEWDMENDNMDKLIIMAYYMGREHVAKKLCDMHAALYNEQMERARKSRYHHMAEVIIGDVSQIYSSDYAQDMTETFGNDETQL